MSAAETDTWTDTYSLDVLYEDGDYLLAPPDDGDLEERMEWAVRRLARAEGRIARIEGRYKRQLERLNEWYSAQVEPLRAAHAVEDQAIRALMLERLERDPKAPKTVKLPSGEVRARKVAPTLALHDPDAFVEWAQRERPELVRVPDPPASKPAVNAIKEALANGEILPGAQLVTQEMSVKVSTVGEDEE